MASERELNSFLASVEKRAFKRMAYQTRDEDGAMDIVQDSMIKLAQSYGDKPVAELNPLFQRILNNTMLDWFRRQKTRRSVLVNFSEIEASYGPADDGGEFDILSVLEGVARGDSDEQNPEKRYGSQETIVLIEKSLEKLTDRQRQAFLLRYWEELDVNETASVMGCSPGSVKTHCMRAIAALAKDLKSAALTLS